MNIHQSEIHAQKRVVIDRSKHRDLCEILDRCGYLAAMTTPPRRSMTFLLTGLRLPAP